MVRVYNNYFGENVKNQYVIFTDKGITFQSYASTIICVEYGQIVYVGYDYNRSRTTTKYLKIFLKEETSWDIATLEKYIKNKMV